MNKLFPLLIGEITRLFKYKISIFGIIVSLIWVAIIASVDAQTAKAILPFLAMLDAGMMSIILLSASYYLEKQEGSLSSMLVSPVGLTPILLAKLLSAVFSALLSMVFVLGAGLVFHGVEVSWLKGTIYLFAIVSSHTAIGYWITLRNQDFLTMLIKFMGLALLMMAPSLLAMLGVVNDSLRFVFYVSPMYSAQVLIESLFTPVAVLEQIFVSIYLFALGGGIYTFVVYPNFKKQVIGG